jgi:hypothetical protein
MDTPKPEDNAKKAESKRENSGTEREETERWDHKNSPK